MFIKSNMKLRLSAALYSLIYQKLTTSVYPLPASGDLITLVQVDIEQIGVMIDQSIQAIILPFRIILSMVLYFYMVGENAIIGISFVLLQFLFNFVYGAIYIKYHVYFLYEECKNKSCMQKMVECVLFQKCLLE